MKNLMIAVAAVSALTGFAEVEINDGVLEVSVASGTQDGYTAEQLVAITSGSVTEIKKTGSGTLVSKGIKDYAGVIRVAGGTMQINANDKTGLGTTAGATYVEDGATVKFGNSGCGADAEPFHIAGTGVDNGGALVGGSYVQICKLVLEADAKIVLGDRAEFAKKTGGFLDLRGHTLTIESNSAGANEIYFSVNEVRSVGTVVVNNFRFFKVCSDVPLANNQKGKFVLRGTTSLLCASADATNRDIRWDLEWEKGSSGTTYVTQGPFNWAGDWIIGEDRTPAFDSVIVNMYGSLRGPGSLQKGNDANGEIRLYGTNCVDFTGSILIRGGKVIVLKKDGLFPNYLTRVQFTNSDLAMFAVGAKTASNPDGFETADIQSVFDTFHTRTSGTFGSIGVYVPEGETATNAVSFDRAQQVGIDQYSRKCDQFRFGTCGKGTCVFTGPFIGAPLLNIGTYGDMRFSNPENDPDRANMIGKAFVKMGTVTFENAGTIDLNGGELYAEGLAGAYVPYVSFTNTVVVNGTIGSPESGNAANGKVEFLAGSVATNRFSMSTDGTPCAGTIAVRGGDVHGKGADGYVGNIGQGCLLVESGRMYLNNYNYFAMRQTGVGQLYVLGGACETANWVISAGQGGTGVVYQTGGTINTGSGGFRLGEGSTSYANANLAHSHMSVAGGLAKTTGWTTLGAGSLTTSFLNLIGGTLETRCVKAEASKDQSYRDVAFDGGALRAISTTSAFFTGDDMTVTVYAGGATFDTAGCDVSLGHALVAATGKGVKTIAMPKASYTGFAAPPVVTIKGDGRGATAVPVYDHATGTVTGIRVTSPGYGYTTATASMNRGSSDYYSKSIALEVTLADNTAPVKLTKRGAGTLTLSANDLPANAVVSVEGGSLAGAGVTFTEYAADIAASGYGTIPSWPDGAVLSIANLDRIARKGRYVLVAFGTAPTAVPALKDGCVLPKGWKLHLSGNRLVLYKPKGILVRVR